jgi:ABC-type Fe3+-hydroxamate transport system substrate-binding protein
MRIVSLVPSITETLFELGIGDHICGITTFCILPESGVASKTKVGGTKNPDRKKILDLKPDIILMNSEENRKEDADFFTGNGLSIHNSMPASVDEAAELVSEVGTLFGVQEKANELSDRILTTAATIKPVQRYRSLILIWKRPYWTVNQNTYVDSICRCAGFDNAFAMEEERYPKISDAQIRSANPDAALFPDEPYVFKQKDLDEFTLNFPEIEAVKERRLFLFDGKYLTWHGYRTLIALQNLPEILRPQ